MRLADGPAVECDVLVAAGAAPVWELAADIGTPALFSPELREARWLDGAAGPSLAARFECRNSNAPLGEWRTLCHIVSLDPPRRIAWAVTDPDGRFGGGPPDPGFPLATWHFQLDPEDAGIRLRHGATLGPAPSGLTLAIARWPDKEEQIVERRLASLRAGITQTLEGIRALAEQRR